MGLEISGMVCSSLRFRRRQKKIPAIIAAMSASPAMTPPTIEPTGVFGFEVIGVTWFGDGGFGDGGFGGGVV